MGQEAPFLKRAAFFGPASYTLRLEGGGLALLHQGGAVS
jgi:hypothetical protein